MSRTKTLPLDSIEIHGGTQARAGININFVDEYAQAMESGAEFPPCIVFSDGAQNWMGDGFHRYHAARKLMRTEIACEIRTGTLRDAILFACGANQAHGIPRSAADKRTAVNILLTDKEWKKRGVKWIADQCGVSESVVRRLVDELLETRSSKSRSDTKLEGRDGKFRPAKYKPRPRKPVESVPPIDAKPETTKPIEFDPDKTPQRKVAARQEPRQPKEDTTYIELWREFQSAIDSFVRRCPIELRAAILQQAREYVQSREVSA